MATYLKRGRVIQSGEKTIDSSKKLTKTEIKLAHSLGVPVIDDDGQPVVDDNGGNDE